MAKVYYERRSVANALGTNLNGLSWNIGQVREGFQSEEHIQPPMVAIHFLPSRYLELQLGRKINAEKSFTRRIQVDCYMETEPRAMAIGDDVADFLDQMFINIVNPSNTVIGSIYVPDSESIIIETLPPEISEVRVLRWRSIVQATLQADYIT